MLSWDQTPALATMRRCRAWVEIDLGALQHNVQQLTQHLGTKAALMAVVKADAYGHGAIAVAQTALSSGASWLGVATVPEGVELREAGIDAPILIMGAVNSAEEVRAIARWQLQPTLQLPSGDRPHLFGTIDGSHNQNGRVNSGFSEFYPFWYGRHPQPASSGR